MFKRFTLSLVLAASIFSLQAQSIHDIEVGGGPNGPEPYYSPQFITILVGDIVRWTNSGGTHNVDGSLATHPDNPEGFYSNDPNNALWVFEHTFSIAGEYDFECSAFDHNETQFGTINVVAVGLEELDDIELEVYPNPVSDFLVVSAKEEIEEISVNTLDMRQISTVYSGNGRLQEMINVSVLATGEYLLLIRTTSGIRARHFLKK